MTRRLSIDQFPSGYTPEDKIHAAYEKGAKRRVFSSAGAVARADRLGELGIWVGSTPPATTITYAQWVAGNTGYWAWIEIP